jgi:uncharacterized protein (DUF427 family)
VGGSIEIEEQIISNRNVSYVDQWFEENQPIYQHPKDPHKRIDVLPSSRKVSVSVDGVILAESTHPVILHETGLKTRFYLPKVDVSIWFAKELP